MKQLSPTIEDPQDFVINWKIIGKHWPMRDAIQNAVIDTLETNHGENPSGVEEELWI